MVKIPELISKLVIVVLILVAMAAIGLLVIIGTNWLVLELVYRQHTAARNQQKMAQQDQRQSVATQIENFYQTHQRYPESLAEVSITLPQPVLINLSELKYQVNDTKTSYQLSYQRRWEVYCYFGGQTNKPLVDFSVNRQLAPNKWQFCWSLFDLL